MAKRDIPNGDEAGFVAEKPEHCFACYRLIRPGQIYYLTTGGLVHGKDCALLEGVVRVPLVAADHGVAAGAFFDGVAVPAAGAGVHGADQRKRPTMDPLRSCSV